MQPTTTLTQVLQRGLAAHEAGQLSEACTFYRQVLKIAPQNPDALHLLGVALGALGELDPGIASISEAIQHQPAIPNFHFNLGNLLLQHQHLAEAANAFQSALALDPKMPDAWANLGLVQAAQNKSTAARESWKQSLLLNPKQPNVWLRLAQSFHDQHLLREATEIYTAAFALVPDNAALACNLGNVLREQSRFAEASQTYRRAITIDPRSHEAWNNLGIVLHELNQSEEAIIAFQNALHLKPDYAEAYSNSAPALLRLHRFAEAAAACHQALALAPAHDGALTNLGNAFLATNQLDEAAAAFARAHQINPANHAAHKNEGIARLLAGDLRNGFALYEARSEEPEFLTTRRTFTCPLWTGVQPLAERSLLLHAEQGLGDTIQFVRYVPLLAAQGARVILEAPATLLELFADLPGVAAIFQRGQPVPAADFHCPLLSLPFACQTDSATVPAATPYLRPRAPRITRWQQNLSEFAGPKVGVVWSGNPNHKNDHNRSIPLSLFKSVLSSPAIHFISLQPELRADEKPLLAEIPSLKHGWLQGADFSDTAGLIQSLDLVISVDTSVAHLAGAVGKTTWILLPFAPDWRWLLATDRSPWYPTARLFRQPAAGNWPTVLAQITAELSTTFNLRKN